MQNIIITMVGVSAHLSGYKYLWLKRVVGFDSTQTCAKCLIGHYEPAFSPKWKTCVPMHIAATKRGEVLYMCGVSSPYQHHNNLHCAFVSGSGVIEVRTYRDELISIQNAVQIEFNDEAATALSPRPNGTQLACRNFQFGATYFRTQTQATK